MLWQMGGKSCILLLHTDPSMPSIRAPTNSCIPARHASQRQARSAKSYQIHSLLVSRFLNVEMLV
jgi:hypothetical protein